MDKARRKIYLGLCIDNVTQQLAYFFHRQNTLFFFETKTIEIVWNCLFVEIEHSLSPGDFEIFERYRLKTSRNRVMSDLKIFPYKMHLKSTYFMDNVALFFFEGGKCRSLPKQPQETPNLLIWRRETQKKYIFSVQ